MRAEKGAGFDPTLIAPAIRDAGFSARELMVTAHGELTEHEGLPALRLAGSPELLILAGGTRLAELTDSGLSPGTGLRVTGHLHPSQEEKPPGMEVDEWQEVERSEQEGPSL